MGTEIHHLASVSCDLDRTIKFYSTILGLRVLHKNLPCGGPRVCHFYWDDRLDNFITFYHCPGLKSGSTGINMVQSVSFSVNLSSLGFWVDRLKTAGISFCQRTDVFSNALLLYFKDPDGLALELVFTVNDNRTGLKSDVVPGCFSIKGFYKIAISSNTHQQLTQLFIKGFMMKHLDSIKEQHRYGAYNRPGCLIDIEDGSERTIGASGSGMVHHIALQMRNKEAYAKLYLQSGKRSKSRFFYQNENRFSSFYHKEAGGILFELIMQWREHSRSIKHLFATHNFQRNKG